MKNKQTFCEECRDDVNFIVKEVETESTLKGKVYTYKEKRAYCPHCGEEVWVGEIMDKNLTTLYDLYRKDHGLISHEKVLEIPKKYAIGKRPLSLLLGWGEQTFSRYFDGDVPSKQYSEILERIYEDPKYYLSLLEKNKGNLSSEKSYLKSKKAVKTLLSKEVKESKMNTAIAFLLYYCEDITPLALQKALYYIQGFYHAFRHEFIFEEDCEAWTHGPVYREIYNRYRNYRFDPIQSQKSEEQIELTSQEKDIFENVAKYICCFSGKTLESFTHSETPWRLARKALPDDTPSNNIIEKKEIARYFDSLINEYQMSSPEDIKHYSQKMFQKLQQI